MERVFDNCNILLSATLSEPPAKVGRFNHDREDYENYRIGPDGVFEYSPFCATFNASGQPAATVPMHWTTNGLPVGVHFASAFGEDATLIALCAGSNPAEGAAVEVARLNGYPQGGLVGHPLPRLYSNRR